MGLSRLLLFFMLVTALVLVTTPRLIHGLIALCVFSALLTLQYVFSRAPDIAITEAALGTGLSTLVYLTAIRKTALKPSETPPAADPIQHELREETHMIALKDYITPNNIYLLRSRKRDPIIHEIIQHCLHDMDPAFTQSVVHGVLSKRRGASPMDMNLGNGFALIHARHDACEDVRLAIGLLPEPRNLYRGDMIHTVIGIVLPSSQSREYLAFLARFGRLMYAPETSARFEEAGRRFAAGHEEEAKQQLTDLVHTFEEA